LIREDGSRNRRRRIVQFCSDFAYQTAKKEENLNALKHN